MSNDNIVTFQIRPSENARVAPRSRVHAHDHDPYTDRHSHGGADYSGGVEEEALQIVLGEWGWSRTVSRLM